MTADVDDPRIWQTMRVTRAFGLSPKIAWGITGADRDGHNWKPRSNIPNTVRNHLTGVFMRRASFIAFTVGGMLVLGPAADVWAQSGAGGMPRTGWYVGGSIGANGVADIDQEGWNRESTCYPTDACFDAAPVSRTLRIPGGITISWLLPEPRSKFSAGRFFDRTHLELSLGQRKNGLDQMFRNITEYDGTPLRERSGSSVVSKSQASIDHLAVRTLTLNAYYDFSDTFGADFSIPGWGAGSRVHQGVWVALLLRVRGHFGQCSGVRSAAVVLQ